MVGFSFLLNILSCVEGQIFDELLGFFVGFKVLIDIIMAIFTKDATGNTDQVAITQMIVF